MKKTYEAPSVEKIEFQYRDQVVAASGGSIQCTIQHNYVGNQAEQDNCYDNSYWISKEGIG